MDVLINFLKNVLTPSGCAFMRFDAIYIVHEANKQLLDVYVLLLISFNPYCANHKKCCLLFSPAEMFKKPLWQTVWTQIRLLL